MNTNTCLMSFFLFEREDKVSDRDFKLILVTFADFFSPKCLGTIVFCFTATVTCHINNLSYATHYSSTSVESNISRHIFSTILRPRVFLGVHQPFGPTDF